jgi:alpha-N-acetylglucosamine transferase
MKCAYVTLLTDDNQDFIYNIILALSLIKTNTKHDIILLYTLNVPQYKLNIFSKIYTKLIKVEHVRTSQQFFVDLTYFFTKFQVFNLTSYDKILYLDKYQYISKNIDYIFNFKYPAGFCYKDKFKRTHMFLIKPNEIIYEKALNEIDEANLKKKYMDKDILNSLFPKINCFSSKLDFQKYLRLINNQQNINYKELCIIDYNFIKKPLTYIGHSLNNNYNKYQYLYIPWLKIYMKLYHYYQKKKINLLDIYSIISNDYNKYLKSQFPNLKKIKLNKDLQEKLDLKLNNIMNNYFTYNEVIDYLRNNGIKIFIYGGTLRDLYGDIEIKDIDCLYIGDYKKIYKTLKKNKLIEFKQGAFKKYFDIEHDEMELSNIDVFRKSLDGPCNALVYDFETKYVYDLTGYGIEDSKNKVWRLNPGDTYQEWSNDHNCLIHRMYKMINKGFFVPKQDKIFIYDELYYEKKDRSYWFYLNRFLDNDFYNTIEKDINSLHLKYTGKQFNNNIKNILKKYNIFKNNQNQNQNN